MPIIPRPKHFDIQGESLLASRNCNPVIRIIGGNKGTDINKMVDIIAQELQKSINGKYLLKSDPKNAGSDFTIILASTEELLNANSTYAELLTDDDRKFFSQVKSNQSYLLKTFCKWKDEKNIVLIASHGQIGLLYGAMSLRQLIKQDKDVISCQQVCIRDYPDHEYRVGARWLLCGECCRWSYDWGDGREKLIERFKTKIDRTLQNKSNMVFFDGFALNTKKYPGYAEDMCMLNNYAIARGVKLVFGCYGIGVGGWGGGNVLVEAHNFVPGVGKSKNRKSYPDGELYPCCGNNPKDPNTRYNGTCRSNEELNELKKRDLAEYVRIIQPGALYIHHEDHSNYDEGTNVLWAQRCGQCKEKWPDNRLEKINGGASGIAHGFNKLCEAVFSVKDPKTGYDASRDCVVMMCSPTYGEYKESDENWEKIIEYWTNISKEMKYRDNVMFGFREQFWRHDNKKMRIKELSESLNTEGQGHGIFLFSVSGADLYSNDSLFSAGPVLNSFFEGSTAIFNFSGVVFQDMQELFNSEYAWNLHSTTFSEVPKSYDDAVAKYSLYTYKHYIPPVLSAEGGFIEECCQSLYGKDAGKAMKHFYLLGSDNDEYPLAVMYWPFSLAKLFLKSQNLQDYKIEVEKQKWQNILDLTEKALVLVEKALKCEDFNRDFRSDVEQLQKCLTVGQMFAQIVFNIFSQKAAAFGEKTNLKKGIKKLEQFILNNFQFNFSSPGNSDIELWPTYIENLKKVVEINFSDN